MISFQMFDLKYVPDECSMRTTADFSFKNGRSYIHYVNKPVQYKSIFHVSQNGTYQMKICDNLPIPATNIDCGYSLEPSQ